MKPSVNTARLLFTMMFAILMSGCNTVDQKQAGVVECKDPRPEMCTQHYDPVCATRDNGVRCVTTPCDSTETATYSNGCMACADPAVFYHIKGACPK